MVAVAVAVVAASTVDFVVICRFRRTWIFLFACSVEFVVAAVDATC